jgi:hypothetical protein
LVACGLTDGIALSLRKVSASADLGAADPAHVREEGDDHFGTRAICG